MKWADRQGRVRSREGAVGFRGFPCVTTISPPNPAEPVREPRVASADGPSYRELGGTLRMHVTSHVTSALETAVVTRLIAACVLACIDALLAPVAASFLWRWGVLPVRSGASPPSWEGFGERVARSCGSKGLAFESPRVYQDFKRERPPIRGAFFVAGLKVVRKLSKGFGTPPFCPPIPATLSLPAAPPGCVRPASGASPPPPRRNLPSWRACCARASPPVLAEKDVRSPSGRRSLCRALGRPPILTAIGKDLASGTDVLFGQHRVDPRATSRPSDHARRSQYSQETDPPGGGPCQSHDWVAHHIIADTRRGGPSGPTLHRNGVHVRATA